MTRSLGPIGLSGKKIRASASTKAAPLRWLTATPLGLPVEPEVKITQQSSSGLGSRRSIGGRCGPRGVMSSSSPTTAATSASPKTVLARSGGSSASTGTYAAPASSTPAMAT